MNQPNPSEVIQRHLGSVIQPNRTYSQPLPPELATWYCYPVDAGHSILVVLADHVPEGGNVEDYLCPAPVKTVLRHGWTVHNGYIMCHLPYDPKMGLVVDPDDEEYGTTTKETAHRYEVGELYHPSRNRWPEAVELRLHEHTCQLMLFFNSPATHEIRVVRNGKAEFAILPSDQYLIWLYRFTNQSSNPKQQGIPWSDTPWEYHRQAQQETPAVPGVRGSSAALHIVLVDAGNGILQAQRLIGIPVSMADALRDAVAWQENTPNDPDTTSQELNSLYGAYSSAELVEQTAVRCESEPEKKRS